MPRPAHLALYILVGFAAGAAAGLHAARLFLPGIDQPPFGSWLWPLTLTAAAAAVAGAAALRVDRPSIEAEPTRSPHGEEIRQLLAALDRLHRSRTGGGAATGE